MLCPCCVVPGAHRCSSLRVCQVWVGRVLLTLGGTGSKWKHVTYGKQSVFLSLRPSAGTIAWCHTVIKNEWLDSKLTISVTGITTAPLQWVALCQEAPDLRPIIQTFISIYHNSQQTGSVRQQKKCNPYLQISDYTFSSVTTVNKTFALDLNLQHLFWITCMEPFYVFFFFLFFFFFKCFFLHFKTSLQLL